MTRKDFNLIASTIQNAKVDEAARFELAQEFSFALRHTNERFDAARFVAACLTR